MGENIVETFCVNEALSCRAFGRLLIDFTGKAVEGTANPLFNMVSTIFTR